MNALQPIEYCKTTLAITKNIEESFLILGERLHRIRTEQLYRGQWESFAEFLAEAKLNESMASKLITVYRTFVEQYGIDKSRLISAGSSSLYEIVPLISSKEDAEELVDKAATLRRQDLREEIRERKAGPHEHDFYEIHQRQCRLCSYREKL